MASFTGSTGSTHLAVYPSVSSSSTLTTLCPHCCNTILAPYVTDVLSLPPSNPVDCPTHCGATFCSQSCSLSPHHRSICVGECAPTDSLLLLKNLVAENHHQCPDIPLYPIFCMSLQLLNAAIPPVVPVATDLFPSRFPLDDPELIEIVSNLGEKGSARSRQSHNWACHERAIRRGLHSADFARTACVCERNAGSALVFCPSSFVLGADFVHTACV